ncbi:hypothetical protein NB706_001881 [Xanthomonas sacchari]|nr:hypothetical protein [Xanthomonas sacchari]
MDHAAVLAGEALGVHPVAHLAGVVALRHLRLRLHYRLQLRLHAAHRIQQLAQLVVAAMPDLAVQAPGGDRRRHAHGLGQRVEHLPAQQQVQRAAQQQRREQADRGDGPQQRTRLGHDQRVRHRDAKRERLRRIADLQRHEHVQRILAVGAAMVEHHLALGHARQHVLGPGIAAGLADLLRIAAGHHHAQRRQQAGMALAHRPQRGDALLQGIEGEVDGDHAQETPVLQDRRGQRGHQRVLAGHRVVVGLDHHRLVRVARQQVPVAVARLLVVAQRLAHQLAVLPRPPSHVAAGGVMALGADEGLVVAVERVRLPHGADAQPLRMRVELAAQHRGGGGARQTGRVLHAEAVGQRVAGVEGHADFARHPLRLHLRQVLDAAARGRQQRIAAAPVDDHGGQAEAGQREQAGTEHQAFGDAAATALRRRSGHDDFLGKGGGNTVAGNAPTRQPATARGTSAPCPLPMTCPRRLPHRATMRCRTLRPGAAAWRPTLSLSSRRPQT